MIPDAAVEAAVAAVEQETYGADWARRIAVIAVKAASPHMLAGAAGEGDEAWDSNRVAIGDNPFRPTP